MAEEDEFACLDDAAVPFITVPDEAPGVEGANFTVNPLAVRYLESLKGRKLAVVAIAGLYRTGKSFLLNKLMGKGAGFTVGPTVKACTKGIWLWGRAIEMEGSDLHVLFLDTEGLGSTIRGATYDCRIFALALLLSSFFIYNSVGVIDGDAISRLSLVVNLTKHIHVRASSASEDSGVEFQQFFPNLLWVVRDFGVRLERNGVRMNSREYLEDALKPEDGMSDATAQKNANFFPNRDCVTMVRPVTDERLLNNMAQLPESELRAEFRSQLEALRKRVLSSVRPKMMFGQQVTGAMLAKLAQEYCNQDTPTISSAWDRVAEQQCSDAVEAAVAQYNAAMKEATGGSRAGAGADAGPRVAMDASDLEHLHAVHSKAAVGLFLRDAVQDSDCFAGYEAEVGTRLQDTYTKLCKANQRASAHFCEDLVLSVHAEVMEKAMSEELAGVEPLTASAVARSLRKHTRSLVDTYRAKAKGVAKDTVLSDHLADNVPPVLRKYCDQLDAVAKDAANASHAAVEAFRGQLADAERAQAAAEQTVTRLQGEVSTAEMRATTLSASLEKLETARERDREDTAAASARHADEARLADQRLAHLQQQLQAAKDALATKSQDAAQLAADRDNTSVRVARAEAAVEAHRGEVAAAKEANAALSAEVTALRGKVDDLQARLLEKVEATVAAQGGAQAESAALRAKLQAAEAEAEALRGQVVAAVQAAATASAAAVEAAAAEMRAVKEELAAQQSELLKAVVAAVGDSQVALDALRAERDEAVKRAEGAEAVADKAPVVAAGVDESVVTGLQARLQAATDQLAEEREEYATTKADLETQISALSDHLSRAVAKAGARAKVDSPRVAKAMEESLALAKAVTEAERAKATTEAKLADAREATLKLQSDFDSLNVRLRSTQSVVDALQAERDEIQLAWAHSKATHAQKEEELSQMQAENNLLQRLGKALKEALEARGSVRLSVDGPLLRRYHEL